MGYHHLTSPHIFVLRRPAALQLICLQHATSMTFSPQLTAAPDYLQAAVQWRVFNILAQQIMLIGTASSTNTDLCCLGLETLHQDPTCQMGNYLRGASQRLPAHACRLRFFVSLSA